ncbi:hypothetical protein EAF00_001938 [Botryotinia globosa]|nr:hypothetical protein EAF00_001938 [Botryotinia globosa]
MVYEHDGRKTIHSSMATMVLQAYESHQHLLGSPKGRRVTIPDLQRLFRKWPQAANSEVGRLEDDVWQPKAEDVIQLPKLLIIS